MVAERIETSYTDNPSGPKACNITLHEYFAGQAIIGFLSAPEYTDEPFPVLAGFAYCLADCMIAERIKREEKSEKVSLC